MPGAIDRDVAEPAVGLLVDKLVALARAAAAVPDAVHVEPPILVEIR